MLIAIFYCLSHGVPKQAISRLSSGNAYIVAQIEYLSEWHAQNIDPGYLVGMGRQGGALLVQGPGRTHCSMPANKTRCSVPE